MRKFAAATLGRRPSEEPTDLDQLRALRVDAARRVPAWQERQETDLVRRGPFFVDVETDCVFVGYRGTIFARGEVKPAFAIEAPLLFYATADGELVFFEPAGSRTWSELVAQKVQRERASAR